MHAEPFRSEIVSPTPYAGTVGSVSDFLKIIAEKFPKSGQFSEVWFRGDRKTGRRLSPTIYREKFSKNVRNEKDRLQQEQEILREFRAAIAGVLDPNDFSKIYFSARHHGLPTRLLDWTTHPLIALYFAVAPKEEAKKAVLGDGEIVAFKANDRSRIWYQRDEFIDDIMRFLLGESERRKSIGTLMNKIIPLRPDNRVERVVQQFSRFTLHMPHSRKTKYPSLIRLKVIEKQRIREELRILHMNAFTAHNDVSHLSAALKEVWNIWD